MNSIKTHTLLVAPLEYFLKHYGLKRDVFGVLHRMRTWYNAQARHAAKDGDTYSANRFAYAADTVSARITAAEEFYA